MSLGVEGRGFSLFFVFYLRLIFFSIRGICSYILVSIVLVLERFFSRVWMFGRFMINFRRKRAVCGSCMIAGFFTFFFWLSFG